MGGYLATMPAGGLNVALSNFAKDWRDQKYVGDLYAPRVPVAKQSFQYVVWSQDDFRAPDSTLRAPGDAAKTIRNSYSTDTYFAKAHALKSGIPVESESYSLGLGFSARKRAATSLIRRLNLAREIEIAAAALSTGNFPNGVTLAGTSMWDAYITNAGTDTSNPITDVEKAKETLRQVGIADEEMVLALSSPTVTILVNHPEIVDRFKYTNVLGVIDLDKLASVFGVKCVRAGAVKLSRANAKTWVWGNNAFLGYAQAAPTMDDLSCMKTFSWTGEQGGALDMGLIAPGADGWAVQEWPDPERDKKTWWESAEWYYDTKVTAQETGYPLLNVCAGDTMELVAGDVEG